MPSSRDQQPRGRSLADVEYETHREALSPILRDCIAHGRSVSLAEYDAARSVSNKARKATHPLFEEVDVLLTFSAPGLAPLRDSTGDATYT